MLPRIALGALVFASVVGTTGFSASSGTLRVYNISALDASVSVDSGPYQTLGNSAFSSHGVTVGRHVVSVRRGRATTSHVFSLTTTNAYNSPAGGAHWCVRLGNGSADLLPAPTCGQLVDEGG